MADNFLCRYEKAFRYSMNTYPIGDSPLEISAACLSFAPLQNRAEITVLQAQMLSGTVRVNKASVKSIELKIVTDLELEKKKG